MKRPRRSSVLALLGIAGAAAVSPVLITAVSGAVPPPPDLFAQPAGPPGVQLYKDGRLLVRFDGFIPNSPTAGPFEIRASNENPVTGVMANVQQWIGTTAPGEGGSIASTGNPPRVQFEAADDHNHFHMKNAAEYTLRTPDGTATVALAQKTLSGFCLEDTQGLAGEDLQGPYSALPAALGGNNFCWQNHVQDGHHFRPDGTTPMLIEGISPGRRDVYFARLSYQWVDISSVAPGNYKLATRVDPDNVVFESDETNNGPAMRDATVPGYVANPRSAPLAATVTVPLTATTFTATDYSDANGSGAGTPPERLFKIVAGPAHGTINLPLNQELTGNPTVVYTPSAGSTASDSFQYVAYFKATAADLQTRIYPTNPAPATVNIVGATPTVAISGAPPRLTAGTSVALSAAVTNGPKGVTWSTTGGSITPAGVLTAPTTVPAGGSVTVRATSVDTPSVSAAATIAIDAVPVQKPAPGGGAAGAGDKALSNLTIKRIGSRTIVGTVITGARGGTVRITATFGKKVLGRCTKTVGGRKAVTCKVTLAKAYNLKKVRVTAIFTRGKTTAVRRSFVVR